MLNRLSSYTISDEAIKYISLFESVTGCKVKDCIIGERILFVVGEAQAGIAIGRNGSNVRKIEGLTNKNVRIIEFNPDVIQFIRNYLYPIELREIKFENRIVMLSGNDKFTNGMIIGRGGKNLEFLTSLVKRYFDIDNVKVAPKRVGY